MSYQEFIKNIGNKKLSLSALAFLDILKNHQHVVVNKTIKNMVGGGLQIIETTPKIALNDALSIGGKPTLKPAPVKASIDAQNGMQSLVSMGFLTVGSKADITEESIGHWGDCVYVLSPNGKRYIAENPDIFVPLENAIAAENANQVFVASKCYPDVFTNEGFGVSGFFRVIRETPAGFFVEGQDVTIGDKTLRGTGFSKISYRNKKPYLAKENTFRKSDESYFLTENEFKNIYRVTTEYLASHRARKEEHQAAIRKMKREYEAVEKQEKERADLIIKGYEN